MVAVAGAEVGRPHAVEDITADWMTAVLHTSGALPVDGRVTEVACAPFAEGLGFLSYLYRASLAYEGPPGPATVIVKFPTDIPAQRGIADAMAFYQREVLFYSTVADRAPFRAPQAHAAVMDEATSDFVLVMEDLSALRCLDQTAGVGADDARTAVQGVAALHASFWGADLSELSTTFLPLDNPVHQAVLPQIFEAGWGRCKAEAGDLMSADIVAFGDRYVEVLPWALAELSTGTTLLHGDWRADNLLLDPDGSLAVVDFQLLGTGAGAYDLGYFMSQSLEPEVRRRVGPELVDAYFGALGSAGVVVDRTAEERLLRLTTAFCLIYPVSTFASWDLLPDNSKDMARVMLRRSVTATEDFDALALLPG